MLYNDPIYGPVSIQEPVLLDLMESQVMRRLQGVLQSGITAVLGINAPTTRFEHSVGVMLLVRRLGASLEEQIAALLHDASHTAFSHVIDYVLNGHKSQGYHEEVKEAYLAASDIPAILARHGYKIWRTFLQEQNFPLLEQPAPALCADRLDYFFRDSQSLGLASSTDVAGALQHTVSFNGRIVVDDLETARWMAATYMAADEASWANFREVGLYELTARAIRTALQAGYLSEQDFWLTDVDLWEKLQSFQLPAIQEQVRLISPQTRFEWDPASPTFQVSTKLRTIDPDVLIDDNLLPLSQVDPAFEKRRSGYLASKSGMWPVRVIDPMGTEELLSKH